MQKQRKPFSLMAFIRPHRAGFITSTVLAVLSVTSGMIPYFAVARMVNLLISGEKNFSIYLTWGAVALIAICSSLFFTASPPGAPMRPLSMCCRSCESRGG